MTDEEDTKDMQKFKKRLVPVDSNLGSSNMVPTALVNIGDVFYV